jgi:glyoxylase-like metal-dependent hydrolase (beta-lactamase superfamily II)
LVVACWWSGSSRAAESSGGVTTASEHLQVYCGPTNVGIIRDGTKALLIDCGEGSVAAVLPQMGIATVDAIWFTHHHRDQACGAYRFAAGGARICVPAAERAYFENVAAYWQNPKNRWHLYNQHPHHLMLAESVRVDATLADGQTVAWGPAKITVIDTPGHTDGSLSYLVEVDGVRAVFCGDAIYDAGQVWDLWSLQKRPGKESWPGDYHGFLGARPQLEKSLGRIKAAQPHVLVPSHGQIMKAPGQAIALLTSRLDAAYERYVAISAARHYFPKLFTEYAGKSDQMPIRPGKPVPGCLRHFGTTWMLISQDKAALAMDCGTDKAVETIQAMLAKGEISSIEGLWITHYHDDHVDSIPAFQKAFPNCPCITDRAVAEVITKPMAWRLPCISPSVARVDRVTKDGESWQWHEFKLTAYHFPGQTLYHSGLFVEGQDLRMLFVGDSFTMAGIDDYCMHNRNWLGPGVGFDRCVALIQELRPTHIFNPHISPAFDFTDEQCRFMRANLAEREKLFGELVPWDNANYGMDEPWMRCDPYEQKAEAGKEVTLELVISNHSAQPRTASCRLILPRAWDGKGTDPAWPPEIMLEKRVALSNWSAPVEVPAKTEGRIRLLLRIPADVKPGRYVIPVDVRYDRWALPQFTEAIVEL